VLPHAGLLCFVRHSVKMGPEAIDNDPQKKGSRR
jgi:hypothetical protein